MFLHFSVFAGYVVPLAGLLAPIIIWQMKKNEMPSIDEHGKIVANFLISFFIYGLIGGLLTFVLIGIPILIVLGIVAIALPIIGGIKANSGEAWKYPGTISFIK
jgi:uncharacterized Tic20 family protein